MARYIDVNKLINKYEQAIDDDWNKRVAPSSWSEAYDCVIADIDDCPTADVQEVKHGEWVTATTGLAVSNKHYYCSVCHRMTPANAESKYCPNCGVKMKRSRRK